jgi:signal transduction histidine kinase
VERPGSHTSLEELVREHAALRRVAVLVAREPSPAEVFEAVAREVGTLLGARRAQLVRVASPEEGIVAASWSDGTLQPVPVGHRAPLDGSGVLGRMLRHPRPVRIEDWDETGGGVAALMRSLGIRSGAAGPIVIGGRVWGAVAAVWSDPADMPVGAEDRVAAFAELVAHAIENAEARDEIAASRARLVEAADEARRRIERDLHDGAQQRLISIGLALRHAQHELGDSPAKAGESIDGAVREIDIAAGELQELARGVRPAQLDAGLTPALRELAARAPLPVQVKANGERFPQELEAAAYFIASEGLTNAVKHSAARQVTLSAERLNGTLAISISDDGIGGAAPNGGSGLRGLADRAAAHGGTLAIESERDHGTVLTVELPCE